jgi:hypothetical protein
MKFCDFLVTDIKYMLYSVQDYSLLNNNDVRSDICEDWHFNHMYKALASMTTSFNKEGTFDSTKLV